MVIELKHAMSKEEIEKILSKIDSSSEKKTLRKHFGKLKRGLDGVEYQRKLRDEWS